MYSTMHSVVACILRIWICLCIVLFILAVQKTACLLCCSEFHSLATLASNLEAACQQQIEKLKERRTPSVVIFGLDLCSLYNLVVIIM